MKHRQSAKVTSASGASRRGSSDALPHATAATTTATVIEKYAAGYLAGYLPKRIAPGKQPRASKLDHFIRTEMPGYLVGAGTVLDLAGSTPRRPHQRIVNVTLGTLESDRQQLHDDYLSAL